ncbi:MAG: long-chain fatty aldehyde decarbonylase, partial [Microcoleaceae cyanobacterium]
MSLLEAPPTIDFNCKTYKDAYSRINAIVIEGEQEAHDNYVQLIKMLPEHEE